jgi:hypothetical protein
MKQRGEGNTAKSGSGAKEKVAAASKHKGIRLN